MVCVLATLKVKEDKIEDFEKFSKILVKMFVLTKRVIFFIK